MSKVHRDTKLVPQQVQIKKKQYLRDEVVGVKISH
jgi:hypothetical protein